MSTSANWLLTEGTWAAATGNTDTSKAPAGVESSPSEWVQKRNDLRSPGHCCSQIARIYLSASKTGVGFTTIVFDGFEYSACKSVRSQSSRRRVARIGLASVSKNST